MMLSGANFLVLDQPTNHLDLESIAALNNGLEAFKYNIIFSCHDHQLTQTVANRIIEITEDGIIDRRCSYDEYMHIADLEQGGLIDGFGKLLVPAKYADVNVISERWQSGVLLTPSDAENKDYTVTNYSTDEKSYYQIDAVDFYFDGAYVGSLSRSEYGNGFVTAYGAYITLTDIYGERHFYNTALELSPYESSYSSEYDSVYQAGSTINYHQGSGQIAFTPECTLDPADVENPYYYEKGVVYSINGEELLQTADYDYVRSFRDGYTVVTVDSKKGLLSVTDGEIIAPEYDDLGNSEEHPLRFGYISAVKDGKFGFLNADGQVTAPFTYSKDVVHNYSDFATVKDLDGSIIVISAAVGELPTRYSDVSFPFYDGCMAFIAENAEGQSAVIDLYGRELLPFSDSYRSIYLSVDGTAALVYCGYQQYVIYQFDVSRAGYAPARRRRGRGRLDLRKRTQRQPGQLLLRVRLSPPGGGCPYLPQLRL